ncbi:MAG TPA: hypothetical protein VJ204_03955 [Solirubrobacterales bacterium]|nr:hypothetical protein [Solirubrobacterales bacterium]
MKRLLLLLVAVGVLGAAFMASTANAAVGISRWESLTCKENADLPAIVNPETDFGKPEVGTEATLPVPGEQCVGEIEEEPSEQLFTQAAGHPNYGITDFRIDTFPSLFGIGGFPTALLKDITVDTPEGLSVNPEALPQCEVAQLVKQACPPSSLVGINYLTVAAQSPSEATGRCTPEPAPEPGECAQARVALPVYNLIPFEGVPSMVGFLTEGGPTFVEGSLSPVDQHVTFHIRNIHAPSLTSPPIIESRLVFFSAKETNVFNPVADGTYLTMPSNCAGGQVSELHLDTQGNIPPIETEPSETSAKYTTPTGATGCANVPFNPEIAVTADGVKAIDSPEATTVDVGIPWNPEAPIANSYLKVAKVTLPEGMGINPSAGNTITSCSDAQFGYHTASTVTCPTASQIGTVNIETPSLPDGSITGEVYVGEPLKNGPGVFESGEQFRIFIYAHSVRYGVNVRLEGKVFPNATTGQLTAVVPENPQATFRNFRLHFNGGDNGVLTSASTCGTNTTTTEFTPWSENPDHNKPTSNTSLTSMPGGGACPTTLGARKYTPSYTAATESTTAAQFSPFKIHIGRNDGEQEIKAVNVTLPKGLVGRLAGIPYCGEAELAAAAASSGKAQQAKASCSSESAIGTAVTSAGTGGKPLTLGGTVYLTGPYKGAPLGIAVVTPAVAGPFDLGTVVVRAALNVNPATAQVNAVSDPIPNVFGGVKLDVRSIDLNMNRYKFMLNPTNCAAGATAGTLNGGGSNPANAANWTSYAVSAAFQATNCNKLAFKPTFHARISGPTTRAKNPQIRVVVQAKAGQANIARTALNLPHSLFLDQSHIKTNCTRVQLAAQACPQNSIYGYAEASSPLLKQKLKGPVYLVSSKHKLPDLLADLKGQINIQLDGVISSSHGGLKTVFNETPDVPLKSFVLNMKGGEKSLLQNSENLCKKSQLAVLNMKGQNGKTVKNNKFRLNIASCGSKKK